jgi:hypothetical protein
MIEITTLAIAEVCLLCAFHFRVKEFFQVRNGEKKRRKLKAKLRGCL